MHEAITAAEFYKLTNKATHPYYVTLRYRGTSNIWTWYFASEPARTEYRSLMGDAVEVLSEGKETVV